MTFLLVMGIGIIVGGMVLIWWRLGSLTQKVEKVTRHQYYDQNELRGAVRQQSEALTILRVQLAQLASGRTVDGTLIQTGSLYRQVNADEARRIIEHHVAGTDSDLIIVDVRSQKEFSQSHIPGARHIPFERIDTRFQVEIPKETKNILVYCEQGERSRLACDFLSREGYTTLVNMHDGFQKWTGQVLGAGSLELVQIQSRTPHEPSDGG